eukprot:12272706-Alexandrium_andersonii.AAC.1
MSRIETPAGGRKSSGRHRHMRPGRRGGMARAHVPAPASSGAARLPCISPAPPCACTYPGAPGACARTPFMPARARTGSKRPAGARAHPLQGHVHA